MAAPCRSDILFTSDVPGLVSQKNMGHKLLRRPRAPNPPVIPSIVPSPVKYVETEVSSPGKYYPDTSEIESRTESQSAEYTNRFSPVSPPPPSETLPTRLSYPPRNFASRESNLTPFVTRDNTKYILDPVYRGRTNLGTYVDGKSLVKPFKTRGPDPFPMRQTKQFPPVFHELRDEDFHYYKPPAFTLEHFLTQVSKTERIPLIQVKQIMYSTHNYKKLTKLLTDRFILRTNPGGATVSNKLMTPESQKVPAYEPRVPQRQLLIEMAAMIKKHVRDVTNTEVKTLIKPMPRFGVAYGEEMAPHTEIILYEDKSTDRINLLNKSLKISELPEQDAVFHSVTSQYFQGSVRSRSPFTVAGEGTITPSELAILDSLISGGSALSLKAHFISELPDITPMLKTITYLNLSFNDFMSIPEEILDIHQLQILKMRNNPLMELPEDINRLGNLRTLVVSFCLISSLPSSLFHMKTLEHINLSYNKLSVLPNDVKYMKYLLELNIEGNQLQAMPSGALKLDLQYLNVKNNFMHPLFWNEHTANQPQGLLDLAALSVYNSGKYDLKKNLPDWVQSLFNNRANCDCCHRAMFGSGLKIIRPVSKLFGIKNLPFLFHACSISCLNFFKESTDSLSQILYGAA